MKKGQAAIYQGLTLKTQKAQYVKDALGEIVLAIGCESWKPSSAYASLHSDVRTRRRLGPIRVMMMRPKIICHMVSSIDGRLLAERWTPVAESNEARILSRLYEMTAAAFNADGFLMGRNSMGDFSSATVGKPSRGGQGPRLAYVAPSRTPFLAVVFDPKGKLRYDLNTAGRDHIVAVLGQSVSDDYLAELRMAGVSYVFGGADGRDLDAALAELAEHFDVKTILLGGGGVLNGSFLKAGLIDEVSVLVYPGIDGLAGIPSIFEYAGRDGEQPAAGTVLRPLSTETLEAGFVWLRYAVERV